MPKIAFVLKNWNKDIGQYHLGSKGETTTFHSWKRLCRTPSVTTQANANVLITNV